MEPKHNPYTFLNLRHLYLLNFEILQGCECSEEKLSPSQFALCAAESTCRLDCQANGKATGECDGWNCKCQSNK